MTLEEKIILAKEKTYNWSIGGNGRWLFDQKQIIVRDGTNSWQRDYYEKLNEKHLKTYGNFKTFSMGW